jgi:hypothetical protein
MSARPCPRPDPLPRRPLYYLGGGAACLFPAGHDARALDEIAEKGYVAGVTLVWSGGMRTFDFVSETRTAQHAALGEPDPAETVILPEVTPETVRGWLTRFAAAHPSPAWKDTD